MTQAIHPVMPDFRQRVIWTTADLRSGRAIVYVEAYDVSSTTAEGRKLRATFDRVVRAALKIVEAEGIVVRQVHVAGNRLAWQRAN